jgi:hypothetical protein
LAALGGVDVPVSAYATQIGSYIAAAPVLINNMGSADPAVVNKAMTTAGNIVTQLKDDYWELLKSEDKTGTAGMLTNLDAPRAGAEDMAKLFMQNPFAKTMDKAANDVNLPLQQSTRVFRCLKREEKWTLEDDKGE